MCERLGGAQVRERGGLYFADIPVDVSIITEFSKNYPEHKFMLLSSDIQNGFTKLHLNKAGAAHKPSIRLAKYDVDDAMKVHAKVITNQSKHGLFQADAREALVLGYDWVSYSHYGYTEHEDLKEYIDTVIGDCLWCKFDENGNPEDEKFCKGIGLDYEDIRIVDVIKKNGIMPFCCHVHSHDDKYLHITAPVDEATLRAACEKLESISKYEFSVDDGEWILYIYIPEIRKTNPEISRDLDEVEKLLKVISTKLGADATCQLIIRKGYDEVYNELHKSANMPNDNEELV